MESGRDPVVLSGPEAAEIVEERSSSKHISGSESEVNTTLSNVSVPLNSTDTASVDTREGEPVSQAEENLPNTGVETQGNETGFPCDKDSGDRAPVDVLAEVCPANEIGIGDDAVVTVVAPCEEGTTNNSFEAQYSDDKLKENFSSQSTSCEETGPSFVSSELDRKLLDVDASCVTVAISDSVLNECSTESDVHGVTELDNLIKPDISSYRKF